MNADSVLVIAYGNSLRRDDGAGFVLADILEGALRGAGLAVERLDSHQLMPEMSLDIAGEDVAAVVFVDTRAVSGPGDDLSVRVERISAAESASPALGHNLDASVLLAYTAHLFKKRPPAWLITVPGVDFDHGEGLSETTRRAIHDGQEELKRFVAALLPPA